TIRQEWPKTSAGYRTISLPPFGLQIINRRHENQPPNAHDAVLMSTADTWLSVHNLRAQLRAIRSHCPGLEHVTPHTLRRTVATLLENQVSLADASAQLGHASEAITE